MRHAYGTGLRMLLHSQETLRAVWDGTVASLRRRLPPVLQALVLDYALSEALHERALAWRLINAAPTLWCDSADARETLGLTTLGAVRAGACPVMCIAFPDTLLLRQVAAHELGPSSSFALSARDAWEFLSGVPGGCVAATVQDFVGGDGDGGRTVERVRAIFRAALRDFAARDACAARARVRAAQRSRVHRPASTIETAAR